jgi:hypothetical protein
MDTIEVEERFVEGITSVTPQNSYCSGFAGYIVYAFKRIHLWHCFIVKCFFLNIEFCILFLCLDVHRKCNISIFTQMKNFKSAQNELINE